MKRHLVLFVLFAATAIGLSLVEGEPGWAVLSAGGSFVLALLYLKRYLGKRKAKHRAEA